MGTTSRSPANRPALARLRPCGFAPFRARGIHLCLPSGYGVDPRSYNLHLFVEIGRRPWVHVSVPGRASSHAEVALLCTVRRPAAACGRKTRTWPPANQEPGATEPQISPSEKIGALDGCSVCIKMLAPDVLNGPLPLTTVIVTWTEQIRDTSFQVISNAERRGTHRSLGCGLVDGQQPGPFSARSGGRLTRTE